MNTSVKIGSLILKNPVTVASGTAGYGEELANFIDLSKIGAIFTKGLSLVPRDGNKGPRIIETPSGILNSIGLQNVGLEQFLKEKLPFLQKKKATVIPNVAGHSIMENVELCKVLSETDGISGIELNVSCPNVADGGLSFSNDFNVFTKLLEKARKFTNGVLIVKLSPNTDDISKFAVRAEEIGVDAVSAINTLLGMKIDIKTGKPHFQRKVAGLSGPAIRPIAVKLIYEIFEKVKIPVIGLGGIEKIDDILEFMMAGASAVSIGTMNLVDPSVSQDCVRKLEEYMSAENISDINKIIGIAHNQ
ncbi:MAG: dihydroorotate dehydrogenase [Spirochaetes bacterium]|nr:dihydroorotate dehydrogenase [Spirochaetota bacterium]